MSGPKRDVLVFVGGFVIAVLVAAFALGRIKLPQNQQSAASPHEDIGSGGPAIADLQPDACPRVAKLTSREAILALLKRPDLEKDQFENSAQYAQRIKKIVEPLGTIVVAKSLSNFAARYDADAGVFVVDTTGLFDQIIDDIGADHFKWYEGITIAKTETSGGTYVGQNAFGVSRQITVSHEEDVDVVVRSKDGATIGAKFKVKLSSTRAKAIQHNLCVVLTGIPIAPYKVDDTIDPRPTITDPTESHTHEVGLVIGQATGEIVDVSTGTVLLKFDPTRIK